jgi:hypothetical protein
MLWIAFKKEHSGGDALDLPGGLSVHMHMPFQFSGLDQMVSIEPSNLQSARR